MPYTIRCFALGFPRPQVTWFRGDRRLPFTSEKYEQLKDYALLLKLVKLKDLGPYTCQAYNGYGRGDSWTILVEGKRGVGLVMQDGDEEFVKYLVEDTETGGEIDSETVRPTDRVEIVTESATILPTTDTQTETTTISDYLNYLGESPMFFFIKSDWSHKPGGILYSIPCLTINLFF